MSYRTEKRLQHEKNIMIGFIIIPLAIAFLIAMFNIVSKNSYDNGYSEGFSEAYSRVKGSYNRGYQACVEEYNLYLPEE